MQERYSLRFESGERKGEVVPLPAGITAVGRRPGNELQIADASVSGKHAELVVDELGGVLVRDTGSTNGTLVGGERIADEQSLAHGDRVTFGSVTLSLIDAELAGAAPASKPAAPPAAKAAPAPAQGGARSRAGFLLLLAGLLAVGGGAWWFLGRTGGGGAGRARPVLPVPGNLLAKGYSFEDEELSWASAPEAPEAFLLRAEARVSGNFGMHAELDPGEWALLGSAALTAPGAPALRAAAELRPRGGVAGRLGLEFLRSAEGTGGPPPLRAFGPWVAGEGEFLSLELVLPLPPGTLSVRALVEGRAGTEEGGTVDVDDLSLTPAEGGAAASTRGDYQLLLFGEPATSVAIYKLGRPLIGELEALPAEAPSGAPRSVPVRHEAGEGRGRFHFDWSGGPLALSLRVEPAALAGGLATMGPDGYREHGADFERSEITGLLLGRGHDIAALRFDEPVAIRGVAEGEGARVRIELGAQRGCASQLDFRAERVRAGDIAHGARAAEREGRLGAALAAWRELLSDYPFEKELVSEAEATRARLLQAGLEELQGARRTLERANFFRLVDLYRVCRESAQEIARRYAGSEVEEEARRFLDEVQSSLATLETDLDRVERERLAAILRVLEASEAKGLAEEVRSYIERQYGSKE